MSYNFNHDIDIDIDIDIDSIEIDIDEKDERKQAAAEETDSGVQSETGGLTPTLPLHFDEAINGSEA